MSDTYYLEFENRFPPPPTPVVPWRELLWQGLAGFNIGLGAWYLYWRWTASLNWGAAWFALPLVAAESLAFFGLLLNTFNMWRVKDTPSGAPPATFRDLGHGEDAPDRPLSVDIFFPTYSEDPELVRLSLQDAKKVTYPHPITLNIWVLDDGRRSAMKQVAEEEGVGYLTRPNNVGFKAGNLHSGLDQTHADIVVICDADTRPLPGLLGETLGYFRDPKVAWVQTPQWFYDIPAGTPLPQWLGRRFGALGRGVGWVVERLYGPAKVGADPFGNDATMFFDVILRRRNPYNASFCCGATSIHRREAVMQAALREYSAEIEHFVDGHVKAVKDAELREPLDAAIRAEAALDIAVQPYRYHVSEDLFTSLMLHADREAGWRSIYHPQPLSRMLSPQDLLTFTMQRFKYAGGTLDIVRTHNPLTLPGLTLAQRLLYFTTVYSYFSWLWVCVFMLAPVVFFFTGAAPIKSYGPDFYVHALPFLLVNRLAFMVGTWGIDSARGEQYYICSFHLQIRALWTVLRGQKIGFPVTPKVRQAGNFLALVQPHLIIIGLSVIAWAFHTVMLATGHFHDLGAYLVNMFWAGFNVITLLVIVNAAVWKPDQEAIGG
jgi:cellulose synthase (UDP-forming)